MAVIFKDGCNTSANYNGVGSNTTIGGNAGFMPNALGAAGSLHFNFSGGAYAGEYVKKNLSSNASIFQFMIKVDTGTTLTGITVFTCYPDTTYTNSAAQCRIDIAASGSDYKINFVDPSNSYSTTNGTTVLKKGLWQRIVIAQTSAGWKVWLNRGVDASPEITYTHAQSGVPSTAAVGFGTLSENNSPSCTGLVDIDEIFIGTPNTAPSTLADKETEVWYGMKQRNLSADGAYFRGPGEGNNLAGNATQTVNSGTACADVVSEGCGYGLKFAVQQNDQASFILMDNWILSNMLRSNSTSGNTSNNAAPANALNMMCYHYNPCNTDGKGIASIYDANYATDGDSDRLQALWWAHGRWGSSTLTVGSTNELVTPNYRQRALNVASDFVNYALRMSSGTGYYYLMNDSLQTGATVQLATDYARLVGMKISAQYDANNVSVWNNAVLGKLDLTTKAANEIFTGSNNATGAESATNHLSPDFLAMTLSTAVVSSTPSTYGDSDYGYNAFREYPSLYEDYLFYGQANTLTALQLPKSFFTSEWTANTQIKAEYYHDGTVKGNYENLVFYWSAYFTIYANDNSNTTATAIYTNKINPANQFVQSAVGSYYSVSPGVNTGTYGYFDQPWVLQGAMMRNNTWKNYLASPVASQTQTSQAVKRSNFY